MFKAIMILPLCFLLPALSIQAQQCRDYNSYYDCGKGQIYRKIGNRIFSPNNKQYHIQGNRVTEIGNNHFYTKQSNKVMHNDGTTFSKQGSYTIGTDGSKYIRVGNSTIGDPNTFILIIV